MAYGADALRLWAASVDWQKDVSLGSSGLAQASEMLRRLRSVCRFMMGMPPVPGESRLTIVSVYLTTKRSLSQLDRHVLHQLSELEADVAAAYDEFAFSKGKASNHLHVCDR